MKYRDIFCSLLLAERDRWVLWLPVSMAAGIAFYFSLTVEPAAYIGVSGLAATAVLAWLGRSSRSFLWLMAIAVLAFFVGFSAAQWRTGRVAAPVIEKRLGAVVEGRVVNMENRTRGLRVTMDRLEISTIGPRRTPEKIRITLAGKQPALSVGDRIGGRFGLSPPPSPAAPGAFDFQRRAFFQGIGGVGFSYGPVAVIEKARARGMAGLSSAIMNLRRNIARRVMAYFAGEGKSATGSVVATLMTGGRGAIPRSVLRAFRGSGLAHLLAISGLHIGLVAGIIFFGVRAALALSGSMALKYPIKKWAAAAALAGAFAYTLIVGATVPTVRAFLMIGLVLMAVLFDRRGLSMRLVAFAAAAILAVRPEVLLGASFQLSFAAVIALIAAYEELSGRRFSGARQGGWRRLPLYFAGVALTSLIAGAATAPFAAFHFNQFPNYSLAANVIAVPLTALWIMPWAVLAFALLPLGLEGLALEPMGWGVDLLLLVADRVSHWPGAVSLLPAVSNWALAGVTFGGLWLCLWRRRWRLLGLIGLAAGVASLALVDPPDVLVGGRGLVMAVKDANGGLAVSSLRKGRFTSNVWLRRAALVRASVWPAPRLYTGPGPDSGAGSKVTLFCDRLSCLYSRNGKTIALVTGSAALPEDCATAAAVINVTPLRGRCLGPGLVIDRSDLRRDGAYALWIGRRRIRVESVNGYRGERPWVRRTTYKTRRGTVSSGESGRQAGPGP